MSTSGVWSEFTSDPRRPEHADLRASDHDRAVVEQVLAQAYAEGRLDRTELDERTATVQQTKRLGDLPGLLSDLVPDRVSVPVRRSELAYAGPAELDRAALRRYQAQRREALRNFLVPSLICLVVWLIVMPGGFFWPGFVMLGTGLPVLGQLLGRRSAVEAARESLEREQAEALRKEQHRELGG